MPNTDNNEMAYLGKREVLAATNKAWCISFHGERRWLPHSMTDVRESDGSMAIPEVGDRPVFLVKRWLLNKLRMNEEALPSTFTFDKEDAALVSAQHATDGTADTYSYEQLKATCTAYRFQIQRMAMRIQAFQPAMTLASQNIVPTARGTSARMIYTWTNSQDLAELVLQANAVLNSLTVGQLVIERVEAIEAVLQEKRASVAADMISQLDED